MSAKAARTLATAAALAGAGCKPDLNQTVSLVTTAQILAVRSEPAEAAPRAAVHYTALVVDSTGPVSPPVAWAFCNEREPLAELGPVSPKCYQASGDWFSPFGSGTRVTGTLPVVACRQFGPEVPNPLANQPPGRPVDPDATGGYYQPVRVVVPSGGGTVVGIAETRLDCGLAGTPDQVAQFAHHYVPNANPAIDSLLAGAIDLGTGDGGTSNAAHPGESLTLRLAWASCPLPAGACGDGYCDLGESQASCPGDCTTLAGCTGAETYVALDLATHALVSRREGMQVSWFSTAGSFDSDRTGRDPGDTANTTANVWRAPMQPGVVHLWAVLRDDRGGVGWTEYLLDVR